MLWAVTAYSRARANGKRIHYYIKRIREPICGTRIGDKTRITVGIMPGVESCKTCLRIKEKNAWP